MEYYKLLLHLLPYKSHCHFPCPCKSYCCNTIASVTQESKILTTLGVNKYSIAQLTYLNWDHIWGFMKIRVIPLLLRRKSFMNLQSDIQAVYYYHYNKTLYAICLLYLTFCCTAFYFRRVTVGFQDQPELGWVYNKQSITIYRVYVIWKLFY